MKKSGIDLTYNNVVAACPKAALVAAPRALQRGTGFSEAPGPLREIW